MAGKTKSQKKKALDMRSKMYLVLALCSVMLLVSVGISLVLIGGIDLGGADAQSVSTVDSASMVVESGYNKEENTIDTQAYTSTILEQAADAGDSYVDETLFLGDSNTARMYRMFDFCTYDNAIGSVGMTAKSLATFACVQVSTSSGYITMPQAVAKLQPRRVILTFGTNDLNPGYKAADFVKNYQTGIEAIVTAYPSVDIIVNAKTSRPSVCNAEEVCLVHSAIAQEFLPKLAQRLGPDRVAAGKLPVELRLDARAAAIIPGTPAGPADFDTEFLDYILAVKVVDSVDEAIAHIAQHSTGHSEAILTQTQADADRFTAAVDSAAVYVNCSTRFTDGGEFGLGCEMGISTQKLHARGPMGLEELCSYKYVIHGDGQIR